MEEDSLRMMISGVWPELLMMAARLSRSGRQSAGLGMLFFESVTFSKIRAGLEIEPIPSLSSPDQIDTEPPSMLLKRLFE